MYQYSKSISLSFFQKVTLFSLFRPLCCNLKIGKKEDDSHVSLLITITIISTYFCDIVPYESCYNKKTTTDLSMKGENDIEQVIQHSWDLSESKAIILQKELALKVIKEDQLNQVNYIAGVDVAYSKNSDRLVAAVVILDAVTLKQVESTVVEGRSSFPYIPGLFSFRELPSVIKAFSKISITPDLIVCDGQGVAHPRRFGLASHLGVLFNIPTIGCGKTKLIGDSEEPGQKRGEYSTLIDQSDKVGIVLRTQDHIKPIYVSVGHRISLPTACKWVLRLAPHFRLPETTRQADQLVNRYLAHLEDK